ncbi:MAG: Gfo/Idh/MocA family oxidoreductase [Lentisphaeria bacterium]
MSFFNTCQFLNIDVVAGCDFNAHMRANFLANCPGAFVTADADAFLAQDFDAVLLATFCPAHADDAIRCLRAGKHVLSEVTAFHTLAEGVRLVEEVEQRGRVYHLAENYPYSAANMWLANRWKEGLFGELMYAEYEYVHECRSLAYTYGDNKPVQPGHHPHNWRSWQNFHYYCTHSLGPAMVITGTRPTRVEAFACKPRLAGYLNTGDGLGMGTMTPSLIHMSNGGVVRNLMGAATNDSHQQRLWGTLGACEIGHDGVKLRLGASGQSPLLNVNPTWEGLGELAANTGHGGGDFWTLYYFAREILTGEKGPFDIYGAADVTIPGIQALRSSLESGKPMEVPDFRNPAERARYRADDWEQERYPVARGVFGGLTPTGPAAHFSTTMKGMVEYAPVYRAYADWKKVQPALARPEEFRPVAARLLDSYEKLTAAYRDARAIVDAQPGTDGARVLAEMLEVGEEQQVLAPGFLPALKQEVATLKRKFGDGWAAMTAFEGSPLLADRTRIGAVAYPGREVAFSAVTYDCAGGYCDLRDRYAGRKNHDGLIYARGVYRAAKAGAGKLRINADGPFKVFVNGREMACDPRATNPMSDHSLTLPVVWEKGRNEVLLALRTNRGQAWGFMAAALAAKAREG